MKNKEPVPVEIVMAAMDDTLPLPEAILQNTQQRKEFLNTIYYAVGTFRAQGIYIRDELDQLLILRQNILQDFKRGIDLSHVVDISKWKNWEKLTRRRRYNHKRSKQK